MILNFMNANKELKVNKIKNRQTEESKGMNLPFKLLNQFKVPRTQENSYCYKKESEEKMVFYCLFFCLLSTKIKPFGFHSNSPKT